MSKKEETFTKTKKRESAPQSSVVYLKNDRKRLIKWGIIVVIFLTTMLLSIYFVSPYRLVREISVSGTVEVYDQVVLNSSGLKSGQSVWENYVNKSEIEQRIIADNPQVKDAELSLSGLQEFKITIKEYSTVAFLSQDQSYKKVIENGDILDETVPRINSSQPILNDFEKGRPLDQMIEEYEKVDDNVQALISEIDFLNDERNRLLVRVFMNDGNEVLVNVLNFSERLNYYIEMKNAVDNSKGLFDLEAGAYFIPFSEEDETQNIGDLE